MILDERLVQLLVPRILQNLYPLLAPDRAPTPYTVYHVMNAQNLTTHTTVLPATRMWDVQFSTYSPSYGETRMISNSISEALVGYTDPYILGIVPKREQPTYDDISKYYGWILEVLITETLPI